MARHIALDGIEASAIFVCVPLLAFHLLHMRLPVQARREPAEGGVGMRMIWKINLVSWMVTVRVAGLVVLLPLV